MGGYSVELMRKRVPIKESNTMPALTNRSNHKKNKQNLSVARLQV